MFPSVFNLAESAAIIANATCGDRSAEAFCKLSLDQSLPPSSQECGICDASESTKAHPISLAIDGRKDTWWQVGTYLILILFDNVYVVFLIKNHPRYRRRHFNLDPTIIL